MANYISQIKIGDVTYDIKDRFSQSAIHFCGVSTTANAASTVTNRFALTDGDAYDATKAGKMGLTGSQVTTSNTAGFVNGDMIMDVDGKEFILAVTPAVTSGAPTTPTSTNAKWHEIGRGSKLGALAMKSSATNTSAVTTGTNSAAVDVVTSLTPTKVTCKVVTSSTDVKVATGKTVKYMTKTNITPAVANGTITGISSNTAVDVVTDKTVGYLHKTDITPAVENGTIIGIGSNTAVDVVTDKTVGYLHKSDIYPATTGSTKAAGATTTGTAITAHEINTTPTDGTAIVSELNTSKLEQTTVYGAGTTTVQKTITVPAGFTAYAAKVNGECLEFGAMSNVGSTTSVADGTGATVATGSLATTGNGGIVATGAKTNVYAHSKSIAQHTHATDFTPAAVGTKVSAFTSLDNSSSNGTAIITDVTKSPGAASKVGSAPAKAVAKAATSAVSAFTSLDTTPNNGTAIITDVTKTPGAASKVVSADAKDVAKAATSAVSAFTGIDTTSNTAQPIVTDVTLTDNAASKVTLDTTTGSVITDIEFGTGKVAKDTHTHTIAANTITVS